MGGEDDRRKTRDLRGIGLCRSPLDGMRQSKKDVTEKKEGVRDLTPSFYCNSSRVGSH